jgi:hypothetical protein
MGNELGEKLIALDDGQLVAALRKMREDQVRELGPNWAIWAHTGQRPPPGDWHTWLIMAGRGYGKTRAGAEWVRSIAERDPTARIALVADSLGEARRVMVEGPSGLLAIPRPRMRPAFEPSRRQLTWPNGAVATLYSAGEPESLRGPQHSHARRAIAEGVLRQRGACPDRHPASRGLRGRERQPTRSARRRRGVDRRRRGHRRMGRARWQARRAPIGQLALRRAEQRHAGVRPFERADAALSRRVAAAHRARRSEHRERRR